MPKKWEHTPEQDQYLRNLFQPFIQARKDERIEAFKNELYDGWFTRWPEEKLLFGEGWKKGDSRSSEDMRVLGAAIEKRKDVSVSAVFLRLIITFFPPLATLQLHSMA